MQDHPHGLRGLARKENAYPEWNLTQAIIGAAQEVHRELGHGFLEGVYQVALLEELKARNLQAVSQAPLDVRYKTKFVGTYFADVLVEGKVVCELKAMKALTAEHEAQLMHYLKATAIQVGLLLNFGPRSLRVKRMVFTQDYQQSRPSGPEENPR
jgi:GxxExxY protein